jgi:hypothetical protein
MRLAVGVVCVCSDPLPFRCCGVDLLWGPAVQVAGCFASTRCAFRVYLRLWKCAPSFPCARPNAARELRLSLLSGFV